MASKKPNSLGSGKETLALSIRIILSFYLLAQPLTVFGEQILLLSGFKQGFDYTEYDTDGEFLNSEKGFIHGVQGGVYSELSEHWELRIDGQYARGTVEYDGQLQNGTPFVSQTHETVYGFNGRVRYYLFKPKKLWMELGWGADVWYRDIQGRGNINDLYEVYRWRHGLAGIGVKLDDGVNQFEAGARLQANYNSTMVIDLSDLGYGKPKLDLGSRNGYQLDTAYLRKVNNWFGLRAYYQYRTWVWGKSNTELVSGPGSNLLIYEPYSESYMHFFGLGVSYFWD